MRLPFFIPFVLFGVVVVTAIHFNHKLCFLTEKVRDEAPDWVLPPKPQTVKPMAAKVVPKACLTRSLLSSQPPCYLCFIFWCYIHKVDTPTPKLARLAFPLPRSGRGGPISLHLPSSQESPNVFVVVWRGGLMAPSPGTGEGKSEPCELGGGGQPHNPRGLPPNPPPSRAPSGAAFPSARCDASYRRADHRGRSWAASGSGTGRSGIRATVRWRG
jgi:hypothetical protein